MATGEESAGAQVKATSFLTFLHICNWLDFFRILTFIGESVRGCLVGEKVCVWVL